MQNSKTLIFRAYKTLLRKNRQEYRNFWQESYIFLGLSKVEKQLHIEGNHFLFSFHAMHLRQKTKPRKVAHILLVARPRRPLYHQASVRLKPLFFKERNGNEVLLVGTNLNFLEWKKSLFLLMFVMSTKTLLVDVFWHKNCSHVYTCVKRNSVHALANTKQDGTFNVLHIFPVQLLHLLFVNSFTKGTHGVPKRSNWDGIKLN